MPVYSLLFLYGEIISIRKSVLCEVAESVTLSRDLVEVGYICGNYNKASFTLYLVEHPV